MRWVYVVDDDTPVRTSLQSLLSVEKQVLSKTFQSGDSFLEERATLDPGVLLVDYQMPGASGLDVLRTLAMEPPRFISIILTGQGNIDLAVQAMKAGAMDFLEKPCNPRSLIETVDDAFKKLDHANAELSRTAAAQARIAKLSARETDVLKGLIDGRSNKIIAYDLDISPRTVEIYRANVMDKLDVRSLSEALRIAFAAGLVPIGSDGI